MSQEPANTIRRLIHKICELDSDPKNYQFNKSEIDLIARNWGGKIPDDLREYIENCIRKLSYGRHVTFHSTPNLVWEHEKGIPGMEVVEFGFFCFAQEGDGSQFAYCIGDQKIYHLGFDIEYQSMHEIIDKSWDSWPTLAIFLQHYIQVLTDFHKESSE